MIPKKDSLKILCFTHNFNHEGAPKVLFNLSFEIAKHTEYEVIVLSMRDGPAREALISSGIETLVVPDAPWSFQEVLLTDEKKIEKYRHSITEQIRNISPDIFIVNVLHSFFVVNALFSLAIPSIWIVHESYACSEYLKMLPEYHHKNFRTAFQQAEKVVFGSSALPKLYSECLDGCNYEVIHPAIPEQYSSDYGNNNLRLRYRNESGIRETCTLVITVGAFEPYKNQKLIVDAAKLVHEDDICFFLVGGNHESIYQQSIAENIRTNNLDDKVMIIPQMENIAPLYLAADLFVFTSTWDTYPLVILEAMAYGLPIIATSMTGVKEQVRFGFNALETTDDPSELAGHITTLVRDSSLRKKMGKNSRIVYESLESHAKMVNRYEQLFEKIQR